MWKWLIGPSESEEERYAVRTNFPATPTSHSHSHSQLQSQSQNYSVGVPPMNTRNSYNAETSRSSISSIPNGNGHIGRNNNSNRNISTTSINHHDDYIYEDSNNSIEKQVSASRRNLYTFLAIGCLGPIALVVGLATSGFFRSRRTSKSLNGAQTSSAISNPSSTQTEAPSASPYERNDIFVLLQNEDVIQTVNGPRCIKQATLTTLTIQTVCMQQLDSGDFVVEVRDDNTGTVLMWSSESMAPEQGDYFTRLQGDGNLVTKQGQFTPQETDPNVFADEEAFAHTVVWTNTVVWTSDSVDDPNGSYQFIYNAANEELQIVNIGVLNEDPSVPSETKREGDVIWASFVE